jgi:hypothetical protein
MGDHNGQRKKRKLEMSEENFSVTKIAGEMDDFSGKRLDGREALRQRTDLDESNLVDRIARLLREKLLTQEAPEGAVLEVEIRIGQLDNTFHPGIGESDFSSLFTFLKGLRSEFEQQSFDFIDYFYQIENSKVRLSCEPDPDPSATQHPDAPRGAPPIRQCLSAMAKTALFREDIKGIVGRWSPCYDMRFSLMGETCYSTPDTQAFPWAYVTEWRRKKRTSFDPVEKSRAWKVDITETESMNVDPTRVTEPSRVNEEHFKIFEVEFELKQSFLNEILSEESDEKRASLCMSISRDFIQMANIIFDRNQAIQAFTSLIQGVRTSRVTDSIRLQSLKVECLKCIPNQNISMHDSKYNFPGAMPVSLSRLHIEQLQTKEYFISEKADGTRYFFFLYQRGVFLIDRKFDFFEVHGFDSLNDRLPNKTLLDGEIVNDLGAKRPKYIAFDLIELNGENVGREATWKRLEKIRDFVVIFRGLAQKSPFPFEILGKSFLPKKNILTLFHRINGSVYRDDKRHYLCDGVLFTPSDQPYKARANLDLLKWKFLDRQSIDFYVEFGKNDVLQLYCEAENGSRAMCCRVPFDPTEHNELVRALQRKKDLMQQTNVVAEFIFDVHMGTWKFHCVRTDKNKANHTTIAFDTMESIAQNITKEELLYRLTRNPQSDDWETKQKQFMSHLGQSPSHPPSTQHNQTTHSNHR